jgi:RNA polymerase sigma-70 factor (ECF subfamily)
MKHSEADAHDRFLRLFLEHEASLKAYLRSVLFNTEESREVMQDVAVVLWRKFEPGMTSESFRRWAFGVAKMEALAFRRDRARDRHSFGDVVYELLEQAALGPAARLDARRQALDTCLEKLPADQVQLVRAAYAPGAQIDAVAIAIGRTAMAVYKSLHRIRVALATCIEQTMRAEDLA